MRLAGSNVLELIYVVCCSVDYLSLSCIYSHSLSVRSLVSLSCLFFHFSYDAVS